MSAARGMASGCGLDPLPLPDGQVLTGEETAAGLRLLLDDRILLRLRCEHHDDRLLVQVQENVEVDLAFAIWAACYWYFSRESERQRLYWRLAEVPASLLRSGLLVVGEGGEGLQAERGMFWQRPQPWLRAPASAGYPQQFRMTDGKRHPRRPPKPEGEVYRRFDACLGAWVSLRSLDIGADLERFSRWQNHPRVRRFWEQSGDLEEHRRYLTALADDPHVLTLIGCFDDEPFAYFEAYWAKEDRIAPYCAADDFDRGIHMLVGEEHQRGPHKVASWLPALTHYLFLDEPRTRRVVAEPRADNTRMIGHMQALGFYREKEFDFPHKRAALVAAGRESFFDEGRLC